MYINIYVCVWCGGVNMFGVEGLMCMVWRG